MGFLSRVRTRFLSLDTARTCCISRSPEAFGRYQKLQYIEKWLQGIFLPTYDQHIKRILRLPSPAHFQHPIILKISLEWGGFNRRTPAKGFIFKDYIYQSRFTSNELPNVNLRAPSLTPRLLSSKGNVFHF